MGTPDTNRYQRLSARSGKFFCHGHTAHSWLGTSPAHDHWEIAAQQTLDNLEAKHGVRVFKAHVDSKAFGEWCRLSGRDIDTQALLAYANEFAARQLLDQQGH
ncbi:hypothetical protein [Dyella lutea]|uniref:Uncharacterized protein n=1 Tax=Dyella lutea TaxID=2950441 RepID=A0ABT1FIJ5_9GAMM|nr:hypothetical protein [Dyella lutea]MCP1376007.1 hypothetical protein [Dyella lutea]